MRLVNDVHSQLNEARVAEVVAVRGPEQLQEAVTSARARGLPVAVAGGRHAMGGQQFCTDGVLLDTRQLDRVLSFDRERGLIEVEAGIQWPALLEYLQREGDRAWSIAQKQTGADRLSVGGAIAANVHGRGLSMRPFVADVEELTLVDSSGKLRRCSRDENATLFGLVCGGYGLFGPVYSAKIRLAPLRTLERVVEVREVDGLIEAFAERIAEGFLYGDFQFAIDPTGPDFLRRGVFSCYRAVDAAPIPEGQRALTREDWQHLLYLTHADKGRAFELYAEHYLATNGQLYLSDAHQFADYEDDYHRWLDERLGASDRATEMITELYVPRDRLTDFMADVAQDFAATGVDVIYGTVRLIERDDEAFLTWAREPWACVIFNIHTIHTPEGLERARGAFCGLIDHALARGGSYFLTYHRWATAEQLERAHPRIREFLARKLEHDPDEVFQSDWYRHYRDALA